MKSHKILLLIFVLSLSLDLYADPVVTLSCPTSSAGEAVSLWRQKATDQVQQGNYGVVNDALKNCFTTGVPKCLSELSRYLAIKSNRIQERGGVYGGIDDHGSSVEPLTLTSEKDLPKEFVDDKGNIIFPPDILALAKQKGWKAIAYKTRSTGGFDRPPNLVLVAIPGREKDVYLQIQPQPDPHSAVTKDDPYPEASVDLSKGQKTLTVITVDKTKSPPIGQLRLINKDESGGYRWNNNLQSQSCMTCHSTPLRSISPRGYLVTHGTEKRMKPEDEKTVREINEMMSVENLSWGKVNLNGTEYNRGPLKSSHPLGWAPPNSETRKEPFLKGCATQISEMYFSSLDPFYSVQLKPSDDKSKINLNHVAGAMECIQCHNGTVRGFLGEEFSSNEIRFKVLVDKSMPPGAQLTDDERLALVKCLQDEKYKVDSEWAKRAEWVTRETCESESLGRPNPYPRNRSTRPADNASKKAQ